MKHNRGLALLALFPLVSGAQDLNRDQMARILERLDVLEQQNRSLLSEIQALREQVSKAAPPLTVNVLPAAPPETGAEAPAPERLAVAEQEIRDLAQTRVESDHRSAVQLTGMVLFNAFRNGRHAEEAQYPTAASLENDPPLLPARLSRGNYSLTRFVRNRTFGSIRSRIRAASRVRS